ncbi:Spy/CpxP family protein refolding chaperone [Olleya aquimaris]|uniref:LTXXQ motif family protein n=1 Tax=Olleya aquimaris TaxID=639310 RepID=A0A327RIZ7_9FLAO|nr:Spy/CpxP family protein refolding chaperone [Olleya aquimaris]RAJ16879.1 LTXXQ motif family protein [Olleya aquimaris]
MKKNTILYLLIFVLIVVNGFFLYNYLVRPQHQGPKESGNFIAKELHLNKAQMQEFNTLEDKHHNVMKGINDDIKNDKDALFEKITASQINKATVDSLITSITNKKGLKEKEMFSRLRGIYLLCNDKQKERFSDIIKKARRFDNSVPKNPPKRD